MQEKTKGEAQGSGEKQAKERNNISNRTTSIKKMVNGSLINQLVNQPEKLVLHSHSNSKVSHIAKHLNSGHKSSSVNSNKGYDL